MTAIPVVRIPVGVFQGGDPAQVWWSDGKPRCATHRGAVLVRLRLVGVGSNDHDYVCHICWRNQRDPEAPS